MRWRDFEAAEPDLAARIRNALLPHRVAMLGTVRADGSPRISPVEPFVIDGRLILGLLPWSAKARDLQRDERCELHNAFTDVDSPEPEARVRARATPIAQHDLNGQDTDSWWAELEPERFALVELDLTEVECVTWDIAESHFTTERWSPRAGLRRSGRGYP